MPGKETVVALYVLKRKEEYREEKRFYMCFDELGKTFDKSWNTSCGVGNEKEIPELMVRAMLSLHEKATTKIKVGSGYSDGVFH